MQTLEMSNFSYDNSIRGHEVDFDLKRVFNMPSIE